MKNRLPPDPNQPRGLGTRAAACDPPVEVIPPAKLNEILASLAGATAALVEAAPAHDSYFDPRF